MKNNSFNHVDPDQGQVRDHALVPDLVVVVDQLLRSFVIEIDARVQPSANRQVLYGVELDPHFC